MTSKELEKVPPGFTAILGAPYLVISEATQKGSSMDKATRRFYIPFQPTPFSRESEMYSRIRKFRDDVATLEDILRPINKKFQLGTEQMRDLVHWFAQTNFHMKADATKVFKESGRIVRKVEVNPSIVSVQDYLNIQDPSLRAADELLIDLVLATYGITEQLQVFDSEKSANEFLAENAIKEEDK